MLSKISSMVFLTFFSQLNENSGDHDIDNIGIDLVTEYNSELYSPTLNGGPTRLHNNKA